MRSCSSAVRRAVVGSVDIGDSIPLGLVRQGGDDVQVRGAPLARRHLAAVDEEPGAIPALKRWRALCNARGMVLAGLETQIGLAAFEPYLSAGAYDVVMPDVKYVGGLVETVAVAERAAACGVAVSPHNPSGPVCHACRCNAGR